MTTGSGRAKLVKACDAAALSRVLPSGERQPNPLRKAEIMFIVLQHHITNPPTAFTRGQNLLDGNGAPQGTRVLQFYPSRDRSAVFCLWESNSINELQEYADAIMGDSSENSYFEVDAEIARGLPRLVGA
jgi:hypothetical protein